MRNPARDSSWRGRLRLLLLSSLVLQLSACAHWRSPLNAPPTDGSRPLRFLSAAGAATTDQLAALWSSHGEPDRDNEEQRLYRALLQSYSGHPGSKPSEALNALRSLVDTAVLPDVRRVAEVRSRELLAEREFQECRLKSGHLQQRLDRIIEIERSMDGS